MTGVQTCALPIYLNKTASPLVAAVRAGAFIGCADKQKLSDLTVYAECLGLAYQIADDLLDLDGQEAIVGKKTGKDAGHRKCTFPSVYGEEQARDRLHELTDKAMEVLAPYYDEAEFFVQLAEELAVRVK